MFINKEEMKPVSICSNKKQKKRTKSDKSKDGIVYVLDIEVDNKRVVKIGLTSRSKIQDRVCEILTSHFTVYRFFCHCKPAKFTKTTDILVKEQMLLNYFSNYKFKPKKKFGGSTELVDVDLEVVIEHYNRVLLGEELIGKYVKESSSYSELEYVNDLISMYT